MTDDVTPPDASRQRRMRLRYGFNEVNGWWHMSLGEHGEAIRRRLRLMDTRVIRVFVFDQPVPDPIRQWRLFEAHLQAIIDVGAVPMITFAKFPRPHDSPAHRQQFVERCREVVWSCIEVFGGAVVKDWYWCIWNEPNNRIIGGDLTFEQYQPIYEGVAGAIHELLQPFLGGARARIGGPSIDGTHRPYWMEWIVRLLTGVDERLVGFVNWHRYGDWRPAVPSEWLALEMWGAPDPPLGPGFEDLLMARTPGYEAAAVAVGRLIAGRDILNVCGELNTMAHHENYYTLGLNQNHVGAAFYASALIHLIRGGADLEMRWTGVGHDDAYGLMSKEGQPNAAGLAKQLFAQHVRYGDAIAFPEPPPGNRDIDAITASDAAGRRSTVFVNTSARRAVIAVRDWDDEAMADGDVLRLDAGSDGRIVRSPGATTVTIDGRGLAVVTNAAGGTVID